MDSTAALISRVVGVLRERTGDLPRHDPRDGSTLVRSWTLSGTLSGSAISPGTTPAGPAGAAGGTEPEGEAAARGGVSAVEGDGRGGRGEVSLRVSAAVRRQYPDSRPAVADPGTAYDQLASYRPAFEAAALVVTPVLDGWRTVGFDLRPAAAPVEPVTDPAGSAPIAQLAEPPAEAAAGEAAADPDAGSAPAELAPADAAAGDVAADVAVGSGEKSRPGRRQRRGFLGHRASRSASREAGARTDAAATAASVASTADGPAVDPADEKVVAAGG